MAPEPLTLREFRWENDVPLTQHERVALARVRDMLITPAAESDRFNVRPGSTIGSLVVEGRPVLIKPKIGFDRALFLVSHAIDPALWHEEEASFATASEVVDAIAAAFARATLRAVRRGLLEGYRYTEDSLHTVRGRIRVSDQLRSRLGLVPPVEVAFDEFTIDIPENRILRAALQTLRRVGVKSRRVSASLRALEIQLADVAVMDYRSRDIPEITYTRLNAHYRSAIELARLILRSTSYELKNGEVVASAFTIDMNRAFEDFVVVALRETLGLSYTVFPQGVKSALWLDEAKHLQLRPDLSWWSGGRCIFVGDVKYKRTDLDGEPADLYQLLAYVVASGLDDGLLVYAAGEADPTTHVVELLGKRLHVKALELTGDVHDILREVDSLAAFIRILRQPSDRQVLAA